MYPLLALIILILGLILYFVPNLPAKVVRLGEICIWVGLIFTVAQFGGKVL